MNGLTALALRLDRVEAELRELRAAVEELRRPAGVPAAAPEPAAPAPPRASAPRPAISPPPPAPAIWPPPQPVPSARAPRAPRERASLPRLDASELMSARTLAWAGGVVMLLGVVLLFVLAVNRGWIGPVERVAFGALASTAAVALGFLVRARYGQLHAALAAVGAGIGGGYATLLAAVVLYELVPQPAALAIAAGIAAVAVAISLLWDAQLVAALGLVGATLAPGAVALDSGVSVAGTGFAGFVFAGTAAVALTRRWWPLLTAGVAASAPQAAALVASDPDGTGGALAVALGFGALYLASGVVQQLRSPARLDNLAAALVLGSATLSFASAAALLDGTRESAALLAVAAVYGLLTAAVFGRDRELAAVLAVAALTLGAIALATTLDGPALVTVWAAEAAGLAWLAGRVRDLRYGAGALAYLGLAAGHALLIDAPPTRLYVERPDPAAGVAALVAVAVAAALVAAGVRRWREEMAAGVLAELLAPLGTSRGALAAALAWSAAAVAALAAGLGVLDLVGGFDWGHVGVAALWSVAGAAIAVAGARLARRDALVGGVVWLGVVAVHLAEVADVVQPPQRGWAVLALAVPALAGGYLAALLRPGSAAALVLVALSAAAGAIAAVDLAPSGNATGYSLLGAAAAYLALAAPVLRPRRDLGTELWAVGLVFGLAASIVLLDGTALVGAWAGSAAALAALAAAIREPRFQPPAAFFGALALLHALATVAAPSELFRANPDPGDGVPAVLLAALSFLALTVFAGRARREDEDVLDEALAEARARIRAASAWVAGVAALYGLSLAVLAVVAWLGSADLDTEFQRGHTAVSAVWGTVGLVLLYAGLRRGWRALVGAGFGLFGISLAKIFLFDLSQLSSVARAASFLAVGAILLTAGFFYQRLSRT